MDGKQHIYTLDNLYYINVLNVLTISKEAITILVVFGLGCYERSDLSTRS